MHKICENENKKYEETIQQHQGLSMKTKDLNKKSKKRNNRITSGSSNRNGIPLK